MPNGDEVKMDMDTPREEGLAIMNKNVVTYRECLLAMP
jgi:hypothetical protein